MKTYFKLEFKSAILSWRTLISFFVITLLLLIPCFQEVASPYPGLDGVDSFIRVYSFSYVGFVGPVVAGLIYSTSISKDRETGFLNKLLEIIDAKTYLAVKVLINTLLTFIVFAISYFILILYLIINHGLNSTANKDISSGAFTSVYDASKIIYIILMLLVISFSAAAFSVFILGATAATERKFTAYLLPIFYVIATGIFFEIYSLNAPIDFNVTKLFNLTIGYRTSGIGVIVYDLILMIIGTGLLYKFSYKNITVLSEEVNMDAN